MTPLTELEELQQKLHALELKREDRINKYIIPIEIKMEKLRDQIEILTNSH